jgi:copper chaperone
MIEFTLPDMSCGHCERAVTQAVRQVDPAARVEVDLSQRKLRVESRVDAAQLARVLAEAGYPVAA